MSEHYYDPSELVLQTAREFLAALEADAKAPPGATAGGVVMTRTAAAVQIILQLSAHRHVDRTDNETAGAASIRSHMRGVAAGLAGWLSATSHPSLFFNYVAQECARLIEQYGKTEGSA